MSPFRVTDATWLKKEGDRVEATILMPKYWGVEWTRGKLRKELKAAGLNYTKDQIALLNDELHTRGIVSDSLEDNDDDE